MHLIQNVIMLALGWHSVVFKLSTNRHTWYMTLWCSSGRLTTHMLQPIMPNFSCTSALPHPLLECCSAVLWWGWPKCQNVKMSLSHERVIGKVVQNRCEKSLALCSVEKEKKTRFCWVRKLNLRSFCALWSLIFFPSTWRGWNVRRKCKKVPASISSYISNVRQKRQVILRLVGPVVQMRSGSKSSEVAGIAEFRRSVFVVDNMWKMATGCWRDAGLIPCWTVKVPLSQPFHACLCLIWISLCALQYSRA